MPQNIVQCILPGLHVSSALDLKMISYRYYRDTLVRENQYSFHGNKFPAGRYPAREKEEEREIRARRKSDYM